MSSRVDELKKQLDGAIALPRELIWSKVIGYRDEEPLVSGDSFNELLVRYQDLARRYKQLWAAVMELDDSHPSL